MPRGNQLTRQWRLLQRLGHSGGLTIADAAQGLECCPSTGLECSPSTGAT
jgi:hypothetical protein